MRSRPDGTARARANNEPRSAVRLLILRLSSRVACFRVAARGCVFALLAFAVVHVSLPAAGQKSDHPASPPVARVRPVTDDYYGTKVVDSYRYMENLEDPEVQGWMKAQNDYTRSVLAAIPGRQKLLARIRELSQSVPRVSAQPLPGGLYLIFKRLPMEDVYKLYLRRGLNGEDRLLVDPENVKLPAPIQGKGKNAIRYYVPSPDSKHVAVGITPGGSSKDTEMHIFESASGRETGDVIARAWALTEPAWLPDNHSFVYGKLQKLPPGAPVTEERQKYRSYLHVLGTDGEKDPAVFGYGAVPSISVDPLRAATVVAQPNSEYVLGSIKGDILSRDSAFYIERATDLRKANSAWRKLTDFSDNVRDIRIHGNDLYLLTSKNAPRYKVIRVDARNLSLGSAETVVQPSQAVVVGMYPALDALYVRLLDGGISRVLRVPYGPHPQAEEVPLPFAGRASVSTEPRLPGAVLYLTSWTKALTIYAYDPEKKQLTDTKLQPLGPYDDPQDLESLEVKVRSHDGTLVPLSITHPKAMKLDGSNPTLLYGYGAYGTSTPPLFIPMQLAWYENGGVYAVCHVRGGGEYGEEWHLAGKQASKPNTWRDFIACAQYLIEKKYTSPEHLAGQGVSAGGILIGRAITERPELFGAAIAEVGWFDMLRLETAANGIPNIPEFGTTKTKDGFAALYAMSAYHHVKDGTAYPAVLLTTGANDPNVDPWQVAKMTARLQAATASAKPVLLRVEYAAGHGENTEKQYQEWRADEWSFLLWQFGAPQFQPKPSRRLGLLSGLTPATRSRLDKSTHF